MQECVLLRFEALTRMCGICGLVDFESKVDGAVLRSMTESIRHRGPDDEGIKVFDHAGLGHRRLSILDLSPLGHQPMQSPDGRYWIAYNGEVYNFPDLKAGLEAEGVTFQSTSDTEVILHAFIRRGPDCFRSLNGMFAVAIWDEVQKRLTVARDRFGIKPFYYFSRNSAFVFGSEIKAILKSGRVQRSLDWHALHEYLYFGNALGEHTFFAEIHELLPGHWATFDRDGLRTHLYWKIEDLEPVNVSLDEAVRVVRDRLESAVRDHLISDVPVGVFLSGGIDSSAITAMASRHYRGKLNTYSVAFDFDEVDELPIANRVAEHFGTNHHPIRYAPWSIPNIIERLVDAHDEPFSDAANIPLYLLCEQLGGQVKVILQGDGGDEVFAGYRRYNLFSHERMLRGLAAFYVPLSRMLPGRLRVSRLSRFMQVMNERDPGNGLALYMMGGSSSPPPRNVFDSETQEQLCRFDPLTRYRETYHRFGNLSPLQKSLYVDTTVILPDTFLEKVDKSTMAHGIEIRVPFLDTNLTSYVMGLPSRLKIHKKEKKWLLRLALRGIVPDWVLDAPKSGFNVPISNWLRGPLADYLKSILLDEGTIRECGYDVSAIESCIRNHTSQTADNGLFLYRLLLYSIWRGKYLRRGSEW